MDALVNVAANKGRVLCIDDEPHVLRALQWLLKKEFEVHTCDNAAEALRLLRRHDFDVVVSDQRMPGITGVEFLRHVRKLAPRAMRILLTGYSDLDAMVGSVNEGEVYRFITKPWDVRGLPKVIAEAAQVAREESPPAELPEPEPGQAASAPAPEPFAGAACRAAETVLVIDDGAELHAMAEESLAGSATVLHAYDLASALALLDQRPVGIIVSEVQVGGLDATRLLRMVRHKHPGVVTLVASGQRDAEVVMSLINQGQVFRIVPKPVKAAFLRLIAQSALKRRAELLARPSVQRRFAVEPAAPEVARALLDDLVRAAEPAARARHGRPALAAPGGPQIDDVHAGAHESLVQSIKAGFRRIFG